MKKIKISQLPLFSSLKGLYTIGTDKDNRSVRVSLEFIEDETNKAIENTNTATTKAVADAKKATEDAVKAKTDADTATRNAQTATIAANTATTNANTATTNANNATAKANEAAKKADEATDRASKATLDADDATYNSVVATNNATTATDKANKATEDAKNATEDAKNATDLTIETLNRLIPTGLKVESVERITLGNTALNRIRAILAPESTIPNIVFISDNKAVRIDPQGYIRVVGKGESEVHIIPTCNTAIAKTIIIRVEDPTARLVNTRKQIRFSEDGAIRLN